MLSEGISKLPKLADALNVELEQSMKLVDSPEIPVLKNYALTKPEDQSFQVLRETEKTVIYSPKRHGTINPIRETMDLSLQHSQQVEPEESKSLEALLL